MHPFFHHALVEQHRNRLIAEADTRRTRKRSKVNTIRIDETTLHVRPIASDDTERVARLFSRLSPRSLHLRFFSPIRTLSPDQLARMVEVDHGCRDALVALHGEEIVAMASYAGRCGTSEAEIALTVEDEWQHRGIGKQLARRLMDLAISRGFETFIASVLPENRPALRLLREVAPETSIRWNEGEYQATIPLVPVG